MKNLICIAAVDRNFGIGKNNGLLAHLPDDMKRFRTITTGNAIVMGKNTYLSFPKRPLPNRENLVITHSPDAFPEVTCFDSVSSFLAYAKLLDKNIYLCGGGEIYKSLLPYCDTALITKVHHTFDADTWLPNLDKLPEWEVIEQQEPFETGGYTIQYVTYRNREPKA